MDQEPLAAPRRGPRLVLIAAAVLVLAAGAVLFLLMREPASEPNGPTPSPTGTTLPGALIAAAPWPANAQGLAARLDAIGLPALQAQGQVVHLHPTLEISIDGSPVPIPAGIGIDPDGAFIAPIHTHDDSGTIHVESPEVRDFTLGEFFDVWGVPFDDRCLGPYCEGDGARLLVLADDRQVTDDARSLQLEDGQQIVVLFRALSAARDA